MPYQGEELTNQQLSLGYWIATHRRQIKLAITVVLGIIAGVLLLTAVVLSVKWAIHVPQNNEIQNSVANSPVKFADQTPPDEPVVLQAQAVRRDDTHIDIVVQMVNPNAAWGARAIEYEVTAGGTSAGRDTVSLAPGQEGFFTRMQIPYSGSSVPGVQVTIYDVNWMRVPPGTLPENQWGVTDQVLRSIRGSEELTQRSELSFTLQNKSVYGFKEPNVVVLLQDGGEVDAIGAVELDEVQSLQERKVTFRWPTRLSQNLDARVFVTVDLLNDEFLITD